MALLDVGQSYWAVHGLDMHMDVGNLSHVDEGTRALQSYVTPQLLRSQRSGQRVHRNAGIRRD